MNERRVFLKLLGPGSHDLYRLTCLNCGVDGDFEVPAGVSQDTVLDVARHIHANAVLNSDASCGPASKRLSLTILERA